MTAPRRTALVMLFCLSASGLCLVRGGDGGEEGPRGPDFTPPDLPVVRVLGKRVGSVYNLDFSADGRVLFAQAGGEDEPWLWNVQSGKPLSGFDPRVGAKQMGIGGFCCKGTLSPDGRLVALDDREGTREEPEGTYLVVLDAGTGKLVQKFYRKEYLFWFRFSPDSKALAAGYKDGVVVRWDVATGKEVWETPKPATWCAWCGAFSPNGKLVAADQVNGPIRLLDAASGEELGPLPGCASQCAALAFSPDSRLLAVCGGRTPLLWDITLEEKKVHAQPHEPQPASNFSASTVDFSPDGRMLVFSCFEGPARMFELASGKLRREIAHTKGCHARVSPVGSLMAVAGNGGIVYLCDWRADGKAHPKRLTADDMDRLWNDLAADDAATAWQSVLALAAAPERAARMLSERLRPQAPNSAHELERLIAELDDDDFDRREAATCRLAEMGEKAGAALRRAMANHPSAELRRRAEGLLKRLDGDKLRRVRAVEGLEYADTDEARKLLREWASKSDDILLADESRSALRRLDHKPTHTDP